MIGMQQVYGRNGTEREAETVVTELYAGDFAAALVAEKTYCMGTCGQGIASTDDVAYMCEGCRSLWCKDCIAECIESERLIPDSDGKGYLCNYCTVPLHRMDVICP